MRAPQLKSRVLAAGAVLALMPASAMAGTGGAGLPDPVKVEAMTCMPTKRSLCPATGALVQGGKLRVIGSALSSTRSILFPATGASANVTVKPQHAGPRHLEARVPARAQSGTVMLVGEDGTKTKAKIDVQASVELAPRDGSKFFFGAQRKPTVNLQGRTGAVELVRESDGAAIRSWTPSQIGSSGVVSWDGLVGGKPADSGKYRFRVANSSAPAEQPFWLYDHIYPIRGKHNLGYTETNNFGGGRNHKGQDMFASCGTPLAATRAGRVKYAGYGGATGNYLVVVEQGTGYEYVYMHMRKPALVRTGDRIFTGQQVGEVGDTGNASGCHLHFEYWTAPGWYSGGQAVNALPQLKIWDAVS